MFQHMTAPLQLVGTDRCIELIFPDVASRPGKRTFMEWKAKGFFRFHKIGHRVFYDPGEVAEDLARQFRVAAKTSETRGGSAE
jgi:hypothetical protein